MTLCLDNNWSLCIDDAKAFVERCTDNVRVAGLSPLEAVAIGLMDGKRTYDEIKAIMGKIADSRGIEALLQVKTRLHPLLTTDIYNPPAEPLSRLAAVQSPDIDDGIRPFPGPRILHWLVTESCPRRCVYCYANPKGPNDIEEKSLHRAHLNKIFIEAASLGTTALLVAGGEPFLRPDLPEVLGDAIRVGLNPGVTTKYPISWDLAQRIDAAGMKHICLSVDSFSEADNAILVGSGNYGEQVKKSVGNLAKRGIAYSFEIVLTKLNGHALENVIADGERLGAQSVLVVPYEPVLQPIGRYRNEDLVLPEDYDLNEKLHHLRKKYTQIDIERFEYPGEGARTKSYCDIGITKLFVNPSGKVHRCYKLVDDPTLSGADLNTVSVAEAWHDAKYAALIHPPRTAYEKSDCFDCGRFYDCHSEGRCIYQSLADHYSYYSKDRMCGGPFETRSQRL